MNQSNEHGRYGEKLSEHYFLNNGFEILNKNYRSRDGEIDLIVKKNNIISFVEVKFRNSEQYGFTTEMITRKKKQHLIKAAKHFIHTHQITNIDLQFCMIAITKKEEEYEFEYIENAFRIDE